MYSHADLSTFHCWHLLCFRCRSLKCNDW